MRFSSVQFSRSVVSDSLRPHESQHARPPCPSQTHAHQVSDAIQPSHPLSSPSPPAFNLSQHQGLFQLVSSLHLPYTLNNFPATNSPPKICSLAINLLAAFKVEFSITPLLQNYTELISIPIKIFLNKLSLTI